MTRDEKIKDIEKDIYEAKIDLANVMYRIENMTESIQHTYLYDLKKELEMYIFNSYSNYVILNNHKLLCKRRRKR